MDPPAAAFLTASGRRARRRRLAAVALACFVVAFALGGAAGAVFQARLLALNLQARGETVHLPGGPVRLGAGPSPDLNDYRGPDTVVQVGAFSIDRFEVTNRQYRLCVEAGACTPPEAPAGYGQYLDEEPQLPVVWVTAAQAARFCAWIGRQLPTETQWERAARGTDGRPWPWGDEAPTRDRANLDIDAVEPAIDHRVEVDDAAFSSGQTPEGIAHLLGNVSEWTRTPTNCDAYACDREWDGAAPVKGLVTRGLSFNGRIERADEGPNAHAVLAEFSARGAFDAAEFLGLRCAGN